jgi:hypothetical protein
MSDEKKKEKKRRPGKALWLAGLAALSLAGWLAWARIGANNSDPVFVGEHAALSGHIRREKKPALLPALFVGQTAAAYQVANDIPDILDQLYCYCECDKHLGHKSLLSCFTDDHGAG